MSTDKVNRGILLTMVAIATIAYIALYDHASSDFRLYVPLCVAALVGLVIHDVVSSHKPRRH
jgi:mannose/fructose/N-acetylgalactosamine-specific phosphotransferase system component IIC